MISHFTFQKSSIFSRLSSGQDRLDKNAHYPFRRIPTTNNTKTQTLLSRSLLENNRMKRLMIAINRQFRTLVGLPGQSAELGRGFVRHFGQDSASLSQGLALAVVSDANDGATLLIVVQGWG